MNVVCGLYQPHGAIEISELLFKCKLTEHLEVNAFIMLKIVKIVEPKNE